MKVYHGVPKSIIDEHTLVYASLDGSIEPTVGDLMYKPNTLNYQQMPTGYGAINAGGITYNLLKKKSMYAPFSLDFWLDVREFRTITSDYPEVITLKLSDGTDANLARALKIYYSKVSDRVYCEIYNNASYRALTIIPNVKSKNTPDYCHIRLDSADGIFTPYFNGEKQPSFNLNEETTFRAYDSIVIHSSRLISDLHMSDVSRGNYFPNLPQDFINKRAFIRPGMNQQQIKGDPAHSQVITLKVDTDPNDNMYKGGVESGFQKHTHKPELSLTSSNFENGSSIRIKGLNGEIISGVVDADTALFKVLSAIDTNHIVVDSLNKLKVQDVIVGYNTVTNQPDTIESQYTITEIIPATNSIKLTNSCGKYWNQNAIDSGWTRAIEVTASSSAPTVKTQDGTVVAGAWSGLGTNQATFAVGDNPSLRGKNLYIEYALTMPSGNSDFPEIPYNVERAWECNGVEMKPVNSIILIDDLRGKVSGSTKECPHTAFNAWETTLQSPNKKGTEFTQADLNYITALDSNANTTLTSTNGNIPQQRFSFNLIEMIERKFGCQIPGADKVRWVKDNVARISFHAYAFGVSANKNKLYCKVHFNDTSTWSEGATSEYSSLRLIANHTTNASTLKRIIDSAGFAHFLLTTNASNASATAAVHTDYAYIELELKTDSDFTTLYCKNNRAREDKCNPVLVQKETKTVKRYLPSKECFVTECSYAEFRNEKAVHNLDILANKHVSIGVTTSQYSKYVKGSKINLNQLPLEQAGHLYTPINEHKFVDLFTSSLMPNNITEIPLVYWRSDNGANLFTLQTTTNNLKTYVTDSNAFRGQRGGYKDNNDNIIIYGDIDKNNIIPKENCRLYSIALVIKNNELMLYVIKSSRGNRFYVYSDAIALMRLPNRPLIK